MAEPMTAELAEKTKRDYVCSTCWRSLIIFNRKGVITVECPTHGAEINFVTKAFAERQRSDSRGQLLEAKHNLGEILNIEEKRTEAEILSDLGF